MNQKIIMLVGTMAIVISIGLGTWCEEASASSTTLSTKSNACSKTKHTGATALMAGNVQDPLLQALRVSTDEEIYDAVYNGQSLAEIASDHDADVQDVIRLQSDQLMAQLDQRLASGSIRPDQYLALKSEVPDIIARSVYGTN